MCRPVTSELLQEKNSHSEEPQIEASLKLLEYDSTMVGREGSKEDRNPAPLGAERRKPLAGLEIESIAPGIYTYIYIYI